MNFERFHNIQTLIHKFGPEIYMKEIIRWVQKICKCRIFIDTVLIATKSETTKMITEHYK